MKQSTRLLIFGLVLAVLQTAAPIIGAENFSIYAFVFPVGSVILTFLGKNLKGAAWTIVGQLGGNAAAFYAAHPTPANLNFSDGSAWKYIISAWIIPWAIQALGVFGAKADPLSQNQ
jgi:hypothetical protein